MSYKVEIGTAHLWFVFMVGIGRLLCWPLSLLSQPPLACSLAAERRSNPCSPAEVARMSKFAPSVRIVAALSLSVCRLAFAPQHIGLVWAPPLRKMVRPPRDNSIDHGDS